MPHILLWFMEKSDFCEIRRFCNLYHLFRNWNIPVLFGFPSAERMRIGTHVTDLETRNVDLETRNADLEALVTELKAENRNRNLKVEIKVISNMNSESREENKGTKGENDTLGCAPLRRLKRMRRS